MPGSNARALEKAKSLPADTLILDLEDAVAPDAKADARAQVCEAATSGDYGNRELVIRINGLDTEWGADDLAAAAQGRTGRRAGAEGVSPGHDQAGVEVRWMKPVRDENVRIWAMMETPLAMLNARKIAKAVKKHPRFECMVMGTNDLAKETGAGLGRRTGCHAAVADDLRGGRAGLRAGHRGRRLQ
jgi:citrate lyase subunit beta/citryl-CoA lyase